MSAPRLLWIDKAGQPVVTTTANGERNARRWGWMPARAVPSAPAPAPSVVPEATTADQALAALVEVAKIGLPLEERRMVDEHAAQIRAVLDAALPHLTAAPSATRDEVARLIDPSGWRYFDTGMFPPDHPASTGVVHNSRETADALLARFNITPKEDR